MCSHTHDEENEAVAEIIYIYVSTKNRMTVLRQQITYPETRQISLIEHLDNCSKDNNKFTVIPFYKVKRDDQDTKKNYGGPFHYKTRGIVTCKYLL